MALEPSRTVQSIFPYISMIVVVACCMLLLSLIIIYVVTQRTFWEYNILATRIRIRMQKIEAFEPTQETFARYIQRVKIHFAANDVEEDKQKFVFLNALSRKHYTLLANLFSPEQPDSKSFDQLVDALSKHFQPKTSAISARYTFHCRTQEACEDVTEFVANLKKLIVP